MSNSPIASMICRGEIIEEDLVSFGGRYGDISFLAPDPARHAQRLALSSPAAMTDLNALRFDEILNFLEALGRRLDPSTNAHMRRARELSYLTAPTTPSIIDTFYANLPAMFRSDVVRDIAESQIGIAYLEGWVPQPSSGGPEISLRAFGSRTLHIIAGNGPTLAALSLIRCAVSRSDCVIKVPSNDPFTAGAIGRTMIEMAPDHPITRHYAAAYWRGGDEAVEKRLYQPHNIEKIVAWGGLASVRHVTRYIQPGLELIALDPKRSVSIVDSAALESAEGLHEAAIRLAADIGTMNQQACASARVCYVVGGTDDAAVARVNRFGAMVYDELMAMPPHLSTVPRDYDGDLKAHVDGVRTSEEFYRVYGGEAGEGAVIVSQIPEPVDFAANLDCRTANIVPVDTLADVVAAVDAYTQTVGVYPEALKDALLDVLPLYGAQRFVSLGAALQVPLNTPQDGIEPLRRMCKWIVNERSDPPAYRHQSFGFGMSNS